MFKESFNLFKIAFKNNTDNNKFFLIAFILEVLSIAGLYLLNQVYGELYQAIQEYNQSSIYSAIFQFSAIAMLLVLINGYMGFYLNKLAFSLRVGLTNYFLVQKESIFNVSNVEQRIQEDLKRFGEGSVEFWFAVFRSLVKVPLFLGVIITLTQWYVGLIIFVAVVIGTVATKKVSNLLVILQAEQETNEANFRKNLSLVNYEQIKFCFVAINKQIKKLSFVQSGFGQGFALLPFIVLMPLYISKAITMGAFFQAVNALGKVIDSLSVLIDNRQLMVNIGTALNRVNKLFNNKI